MASETTRAQAPGFVWQELDRVRVKGKAQAVAIYTPLCAAGQASPAQEQELGLWNQFLAAWRQRDWDRCDVLLLNLQRQNAEKVLYRHTADRVASMRMASPDTDWDRATTFDKK